MKLPHEPNMDEVITNFLAHPETKAMLASPAAQPKRLQQLERIATAARSALDILFAAPELNMCNYDHEQVRELNTAVIEAHPILATALNDVWITDPPATEQPTGVIAKLQEKVSKLQAALESIPVGARATTECPNCKQQVLACYIEPFSVCNFCTIERLQSALETLLEVIENDGTLIHSDACGCDVCEAISSAHRALKADDAAAPAPDSAEPNVDDSNIPSIVGIDAVDTLKKLSRLKNLGGDDFWAGMGQSAVARYLGEAAAELQKLRAENERLKANGACPICHKKMDAVGYVGSRFEGNPEVAFECGCNSAQWVRLPVVRRMELLAVAAALTDQNPQPNGDAL